MNTRNLELWLGLTSVPVWVCWLWPVRMGPDGLPSSVVVDEFGSPGTLRTMFKPGNSTWRYGVWSVAWFPHVLYRLWPIGVAARHLEILNRRYRTLLTGLWPWEELEWGFLMYLLCMVVAMWREGNETFTRCIGVHGGGHVMETE